MKEMLQSVTQTVRALPVAKERAKMPPKRKTEQKRSVAIAVAAWAIGGGLLHFFPAVSPYWGLGLIAYGFAALDSRMFADFFKYPIQLIAALRGGGGEASRGD